MNTAQRLQQLRKEKGMSQEELAERLGVSRQAVSKWESGQSTPDVEKIVAASEEFGVTTDWLLKGVLPAEETASVKRKLAGRILFAASPAFAAAGLMLAVAGDWEGSSFVSCAGLIVQVVSVALYFIGRTLTGEKGPFWAAWLDVACITFLPVRFVMRRSIFLTLMAGFVPFEVGNRGTEGPSLYWLQGAGLYRGRGVAVATAGREAGRCHGDGCGLVAAWSRPRPRSRPRSGPGPAPAPAPP